MYLFEQVLEIRYMAFEMVETRKKINVLYTII